MRSDLEGFASTLPAPLAKAETGEESVTRQLEQELKVTREDLQSTIEELESSNEELKAANEEVMSMNEELQSANEELSTVNEELRHRNQELGKLNDDLGGGSLLDVGIYPLAFARPALRRRLSALAPHLSASRRLQYPTVGANGPSAHFGSRHPKQAGQQP